MRCVAGLGPHSWILRLPGGIRRPRDGDRAAFALGEIRQELVLQRPGAAWIPASWGSEGPWVEEPGLREAGQVPAEQAVSRGAAVPQSSKERRRGGTSGAWAVTLKITVCNRTTTMTFLSPFLKSCTDVFCYGCCDFDFVF